MLLCRSRLQREEAQRKRALEEQNIFEIQMWEKQGVKDLANANVKVTVSQLLVRVLCRIRLQFRERRQQHICEISQFAVLS